MSDFEEAAYRYVQAMMPRADHMIGGAPLWYGWALREAFLAGATSRWIPCAERMPEIDDDVLVFTGGPTLLLNSDRIAIGCWAGSDWETSLGVYNAPIISHWMPLPEGPKP